MASPDKVPTTTHSEECRVASEAFLNCSTSKERVMYIQKVLNCGLKEANDIDFRFNPRNNY